MGKLIVVVGNTGVGKTALTRQLSRLMGLTTGLEQHMERPYQMLFSIDHKRYSLANQIDYLLYRAEQECFIRESALHGIQDGGLEQDFYIFTRLFFQKGYLDPDGFQLCQRTYTMLRKALPLPDLIIRLKAPIPVIVERYKKRKRNLDIAELSDLEVIEDLMESWISLVVNIPIISVDTSLDDPEYKKIGESLIDQIAVIIEIT